jgi:hypothetical protein
VKELLKNWERSAVMETDHTPILTTVRKKYISGEFIQSITNGQRVIVECPEQIINVKLGQPVETDFERTVVCSDFFGPALPKGKILIQHHCWFRPVLTPVKTYLSLARVAGYRNITYDMPKINYPVLFEHPDNPNILIATTSLSNFIEGRFAPKEDWKIVIGRLISWLENKNDIITDIDWQMTVRPSFSAHDKLPELSEQTAFKRNVEWFNDYMFFEHAGQIGVFEGYVSAIIPNGRQSLRPKTRGDCSGEATMIPALDWAVNRNHAARKMSARIMEYLFNGPELLDNDSQSPTYGSLRFYEYVPAYYCEGRAPLACILASELTENYDCAENILRNLLSLLRTTGPQGFRVYCLRNPQSFAAGKTWKYYQETDYTECRPHYQAHMWAAFIQGYVLTGYKDFLKKAKTAIRTAMSIFPDFLWQNGINAEYARMLLPLAFLVEVEDTLEHRQWLEKTAAKLLEDILPCGAIQEKMGKPELGKYPAPKSNDEYATKEASLIQQNGDPVVDLVYTVNFAFIGFHEAFYATGEKFYKSAADKLAEFFCRIQIKSDKHEYLDGAWMHGFDYEQWDFFGSPSDHAWGPWCIESGWTNTWISGTMGLRTLERPLLCRQNSKIYREIMPKLLEEMSVVHAFSNQTENLVGGAPGND